LWGSLSDRERPGATGSGDFAVEVSGLGRAGSDEGAAGRRWAVAREVRRSEGAAHRWAQSARGSVLGRAGLRCGRTGRRSARVGLARGEMSEDRLDEFGRLDARDDAQRAATHITALDVDMEDSLEPLHPAHRRGTRCMRLAGGLVDRIGDDAEAVLEVRGEHAVVSGEMGAGAWHEGGEAGDEFDGVEHDMRGAVAEGVLESIHDLRAVIDRVDLPGLGGQVG